jgi:hypothetical protein
VALAQIQLNPVSRKIPYASGQITSKVTRARTYADRPVSPQAAAAAYRSAGEYQRSVSGAGWSEV